jgi:hypothetical protein
LLSIGAISGTLEKAKGKAKALSGADFNSFIAIAD